MIRIGIALVAVMLSQALTQAYDERSPLVEQYLHSGQLQAGEHALQAALRKNPKDDEARFGLGLLQIVRGVERLGQSFYDHGLKSTNNWVPFVRLPVPTNPDPTPISYARFRRILDDFCKDMAQADTTLSGITDDNLKLRVRLAGIKIDIDGDGQATDRFMDILTKLMGSPPDLLKTNPEFKVHFDRGDVAWFRAYTHLLSSMLELYLAIDTEAEFYFFAKELFPRVRPVLSEAEEKVLKDKQMMRNSTMKFSEPQRLSAFRHHLLEVCKLNRETWRFIRAETDDDYEWLPNSRQKGIFDMPVRDDMINSWLGMMGELEAVLEGKKLLPINIITGSKKGLNLKTLLEEPPAKIDFDVVMRDGPNDKYLEDGPSMDLNVIFGVMRVFDNPLRMGYFAWFN
jgi:hypothetical protein